MIINSIDLHDGQKRIVKGILSNDTKYNIINASRQSGKSTLLIQLILYYAINYPNSNIGVISPSNARNLSIFETLLDGIQDSGILLREPSRTEKIIRLKTGTKIEFKSAESEDNIRGSSFKYVFVDEFAFIKEATWTSIIRPTMNAFKQSKCFIASTPKGKNLFYEMYKLGEYDNDKYSSYKMMYNENPNYDLDEVEDARKVLPDAIFRQEYLAEFVEEGEVFKGYQECATIKKYKKIGTKFYAGLDLAKQRDFSVLTILNEIGEVVEIYKDNNKDWNILVRNIIKKLIEYDCFCLIEVNSIGDVVYDMIYDQYQKIEPIFTQNKNKQDYVERLNLSFAEKDISIPTRELEPSLHQELEVFEMSYSVKTRSIVYSARQGFHDDMIISLCLANKCRKDKSHYGEYHFEIM